MKHYRRTRYPRPKTRAEREALEEEQRQRNAAIEDYIQKHGVTKCETRIANGITTHSRLGLTY